MTPEREELATSWMQEANSFEADRRCRRRLEGHLRELHVKLPSAGHHVITIVDSLGLEHRNPQFLFFLIPSSFNATLKTFGDFV